MSSPLERSSDQHSKLEVFDAARVLNRAVAALHGPLLPKQANASRRSACNSVARTPSRYEVKGVATRMKGTDPRQASMRRRYGAVDVGSSTTDTLHTARGGDLQGETKLNKGMREPRVDKRRTQPVPLPFSKVNFEHNRTARMTRTSPV